MTDVKSAVNEAEQWITLDEVARILGLTPRYASISLRKGFLKGKIAFRSYSGRNYRYNLNDVIKLQEEITVPAKR